MVTEEEFIIEAVRSRSAIDDLGVTIDGDRVILSGTCRSYYLKQLAQEAVKHLVGEGFAISRRLQNEIRVG